MPLAANAEQDNSDGNRPLVWHEIDNILVANVEAIMHLPAQLIDMGFYNELRITDDTMYQILSEGEAPPLYDSVFSFSKPTRFRSEIVCERYDYDTARVQSINTVFNGEIGGVAFTRCERSVFGGEDKGFYAEFVATFGNYKNEEIEVSVKQILTPKGDSSILEIRHAGKLIETVDLLSLDFQDKGIPLSIPPADDSEGDEDYGQTVSYSINTVRTPNGNSISFNYEVGALNILLQDGTAISLNVPPLRLDKNRIPDGEILIQQLVKDGFYGMFHVGLSSPKVWIDPETARISTYQRAANWGSAASHQLN